MYSAKQQPKPKHDDDSEDDSTLQVNGLQTLHND